ncbi:MAG: TrkH family potassium uptake protein [Selenomonadaceae bacterium]|nr:TrkH family potassium uptake protein [Selenomonadaceae bacterium]
MERFSNIILHMNRSMVVGASFMAVILIGALLLTLPITHTNGEWLSFIDALFTATSATCVVGLVVVDTGTYFNILGQLIIIFLIQIGGVGVMTLTTMIVLGMGKHIGLKERLLIQEALNQDGPAGVIELAKRMIKYTVVIELFFGTILALYGFFTTDWGFKAFYYGYWHAISAFCNGGFDLCGNFDSLTRFRDDVVVNVCIMLLITLGGIGFAVEGDILKKRCWKKLRLQSKVVLMGYLILSVGGGLLIWAFEFNNPATIGNLPDGDQLMASMFQSVTARTAGFNTLDIASLRDDTLLFMMLLMFIGGAPASTAGGIKITTFAVVLMATVAMLRGKKDVVIYNRRISEDLIHKSMGVFVLCLLWLGIAFFLLLAIDNRQHHFHLVMCELFSAFGTVGLGVGITPEWHPVCKLILIMTMFIGRIGILTFTMAFLEKEASILRYPSEDMIIG